MKDDGNLDTETPQRKKIRLIVMGGGYDTRGIKLLERSLFVQKKSQQSRRSRWWRRRKQQPAPPNNAFGNITSTQYDLECYELDLPEVIRAKRQLLQTRLLQRRPWLRDVSFEYPTLIPVDFNDLKSTKRALEEVVLNNDDGDNSYVVQNIVIFEGVMIYLNKGIPHSLLHLCSDVLRRSTSSLGGYLCFADRLDNIPGGNRNAADVEMENTGWELDDWLPKPGLARHMGVARLRV